MAPQVWWYLKFRGPGKYCMPVVGLSLARVDLKRFDLSGDMLTV